jgi:dipeptide/tripeptide permease
MSLRRFTWLFVAIAVGAFALAAAGRLLLAWPDQMVGMWAGIGAGYLLGALLFLLVPRWWHQHCDDMYAQPAGRRYLRALWPIMIGYALALSASIWWIKQGIASVPLRAVVAVLPALAIVLLMRAALRYLREIDELQRRIETEAIGIASLLVSVLYFAGGLLQLARVIDIEAGVAMIWVFPLLCLVYGIARMALTRRYL